MSLINLNTQSIALTSLMGAGVLAYLGLVFVPTQHSIGQLRDQLEEKRQYVLQVDRQYAQVGAVRTGIETVDAYLESVGYPGDPTTQMAGLLSAVTDAARQSNLTLQRAVPGPPEERNLLRQQTLQVTVEGTFAQVCRFLEQVESWPGNAWTTELKLDGEREDGQVLSCSLNLTVFTTRSDSSG